MYSHILFVTIYDSHRSLEGQNTRDFTLEKRTRAKSNLATCLYLKWCAMMEWCRQNEVNAWLCVWCSLASVVQAFHLVVLLIASFPGRSVVNFMLWFIVLIYTFNCHSFQITCILILINTRIYLIDRNVECNISFLLQEPLIISCCRFKLNFLCLV